MVRPGQAPERRSGHSLVELMVALMLLGVGLCSVGAAMVAALHRTQAALVRQQAAMVAVELLDSLRLAPSPAPGSADRDGAHFQWSLEPAQDGQRIRLVYRVPEALERRVDARVLRNVPALPPSGACCP